MSLGAAALIAFPLWIALSVLLSELALDVPILGVEGVIVILTALPISFCIGALLAVGASLSRRWQPDATPQRPLAFGAAAASLVITALRATF